MCAKWNLAIREKISNPVLFNSDIVLVYSHIWIIYIFASLHLLNFISGIHFNSGDSFSSVICIMLCSSLYAGYTPPSPLWKGLDYFCHSCKHHKTTWAHLEVSIIQCLVLTSQYSVFEFCWKQKLFQMRSCQWLAECQ